MKKLLWISMLFFYCYSSADHSNLVVLVDSMQQETIKSTEINMTHQVITALQQRASMVLISSTLWKNIHNRKKLFAQQLEDLQSPASKIFNMYQATCQELQHADYNCDVVNNKLSQSWYEQNYQILAQLAQADLDQLKFNFLCYTFEFIQDDWNIYDPGTGMLLFTPSELSCVVNNEYKLNADEDLLQHIEKKTRCVESFEKLYSNNKDKWVIYLSGHGHPKSSKQGANIAGIKADEFSELLLLFHTRMNVQLLVYSSCYGGGVHSVEPFMDNVFNYPIISAALTDAPIYGFGLFEGVKLPPYDSNFKLERRDVQKGVGLLPYSFQDYRQFFKKSWAGEFDMSLVQLVSQFFMCEFMQCHLQKIENVPLIRQAGSSVFVPLHDITMQQLVQQAMTESIVTLRKPLLLYAKKIKKIDVDLAVPIISMLPGLQSHEIGTLCADKIVLSQLIESLFLSVVDIELYKNFLIKEVWCKDDVFARGEPIVLQHFLILNQKNLMPKFLTVPAQVVVSYESGGRHYLIILNDQKISESMILTSEQASSMYDIEKFVQQNIDYQDSVDPKSLLQYDKYLENKEHQLQVARECVHEKVCKKS